MNGKRIRIAKAAGRHEWCLYIEDRLGVTSYPVVLTPAIVAEVVAYINAASEAGAPWRPYLVAQRGSAK